MSVKVESVQGNINSDEMLHHLYDKLRVIGGIERVLLSRKDAARNRMRVASDKGREIIIDVPRGSTIKHGDVLSHDESSMVVVEWIPEETMIATIMSGRDWKEQVGLASRVGYILGIKHFPLFVSGNEILVPIEGSREDLAKTLQDLRGISIRFEKRILEEQPAITGYEHVH